MVLPRQRPKLSPQTEFCLPPNTTALPTTRGNSGYIFVVCSCFFSFLYEWFIATSKMFFESSAMVLPWERPKLSPQTEFCLLPNTTPLPTTRGSGGHIFVVNSCVLSTFYEWFIATYQKNSSYQQWSSYENGRNSAHRLSFASRPTPLPCQQQQAVGCIFSVWVLISFTIFYQFF